MPEQDQVSQVSTPTTAAGARRRLRARHAVAAFLAFDVAYCWFTGVVGGNVRVVDPGKLYRSSQLTGSGYEAVTARMVGNSLQNVILTYHVKTVLNLRGGSLKDERYRDEVAVCGTDSVTHIDDGFSARHLPSPEVMRELLESFDHARYPILVHCQAGSDRTGLVCAVYAAIYMKESVDRAEHDQLTWRYGHYSFSNTHPMNAFFDLYRSDSRGLGLRDWILTAYPEIYRRTGEHSP